MVTPNDFDTGMAIYVDDTLYVIQNYEHSKKARGGAFVKTRLRNLKTGEVQTVNFKADRDFEQAILTERKAQYLYEDDPFLVFMDMENYDQVELSKGGVGEKAHYLRENMECELNYCDGEPIDVELPEQVELEVEDTDPGVKGNTAQGGTKPATLTTGLVVSVPLFVEQGDRIIINTSDGEYVGRADE